MGEPTQRHHLARRLPENPTIFIQRIAAGLPRERTLDGALTNFTNVL